MTISELMNTIGARALTSGVDMNREVKCGYTCDLLSWVMAHGQEGMAWTTVQTHMNVIAVASLHDMSCVIAPEGIGVEADVVEKANEEGIAILSSPLSSYEICGRMHEAGVPSK